MVDFIIKKHEFLIFNSVDMVGCTRSHTAENIVFSDPDIVFIPQTSFCSFLERGKTNTVPRWGR